MQNDKINFSLIIPIGLMLFSFSFGAGNLIFPACFRTNAGDNMVGACSASPERRRLPCFWAYLLWL